MKPPPFEYHAPETLPEALGMLAEYGQDAKVLAGGQSLLPLLSLRLARPAHLIDVNGLQSEIGQIQPWDGGVSIGAMVRQRAAEGVVSGRRASGSQANESGHDDAAD